MPVTDFAKEKFDIIIQAGQSNSEGTAFGDIDTPYVPKNEVWQLTEVWPFTKNYFFEIAREEISSNSMRSHYGLAFADEYINAGKLEEGRKLLIIRASIGGTGFLDHRWGLTDDLYLRMLDMIDSVLPLNPENRLVALLWHQGETDVCLRASYDVHFKHLSDLLSSVRERYGMPSLPFIAGDFVPAWEEQWGDYSYIWKAVIDAIRDVCSESCSAFVETAGLLSNAEDEGNPRFGTVDSVHFCRKSVYELGRRYYKAFADIAYKQ